MVMVVSHAGIALLDMPEEVTPRQVEAGIVTGELRFDIGVVEKIFVDEFSELGVLLAGRSANDGKNMLHGRVKEAFL